MKVLKPKQLRRGSVIGLAAPSSPPQGDQLEKGIRYLEQLGYRVELGYHLYQHNGELAGSDQDRVSDLHQLFSHPKVDAVFCVRGGYGAVRLLQRLDYALIKSNPKIFVGYSDITALQAAVFSRCGLVTFSGPMVASEMSAGMNHAAEERLWRSLTSVRPPPRIPVRGIQRNGSMKTAVSGRIFGGNLSILASLCGSAFLPLMNGMILLLEEVEEQPYRIDRMLRQLELSGFMAHVKGAALGTFVNCVSKPGKSSRPLEVVLQDFFGTRGMPVAGNIPYGHTNHTYTIPLGIQARLDVGRGSLSFLESGVCQ